MTLEELREATKEYDDPIPASKMKPLTKKQRELWERMRKGPSVSVHIGRGPDEVIVKLDSDVRKRCMKYAADHKLTLSELINRSLKGLLTVVD